MGQLGSGSGSPASAGALGKLVRTYARSEGVAEGRVRAWVAYMMLAGRFEQAAREGRAPGMTVKGGVALELRLRPTPRATDDMDIIVQVTEGDLLAAMNSALTTDNGVPARYEGFTFQRKGQTRQLGNGALRIELGVRYEGGTWTSVSIDLAHEELPDIAPELIAAIDLSPFGLRGPSAVPCLPLHHQIAQKIHGATQPPREGGRNERTKDAVDLLLVEDRVTDHVSLRAVCVQVFEQRNTHPWPPTLFAHEHWRDEYSRYVREYALGQSTLEEGVAATARFIARIDEAAATGLDTSTTGPL